MKRVLCFALVLTGLFGFSALQSLAKGGGHGGGHGGHHGGHHSHHSHHHSHHGHHSHHHVAHHHHGHHHHHHGGWGWGGGWGGGDYAWGSPWAAPAYGAAATWLGLSALDNGGVTVNNNTTAPAANAQTQANANDALAAAEESTQPEDAAELAASGAEEPADAKFMPLGVFSLAPKGKKEATALLHLAVSKDGTLRGTYYDLSSDKHETVVGAVDKEDGMLAWTIGPQGKAVYHAWLQDLTDPPGPVTLKTQDGKAQVFTAARYTEEDEKRDFADASTKHPKHHHAKEVQVNQ